MKKALFFLAFFLPIFLFSQDYPDSWKTRLRAQTTSQGLIYYGDGAPTYSPTTLYDLWEYQDTTNDVRYFYSVQSSVWVKLADGTAIDTSYLIQDTIRVFRRFDGTTWQDTIPGGGTGTGGDMYKSTYDPNLVNSDAFDHVNHYGEYINLDTTYGVISDQTGRMHWDSVDRTISIHTGKTTKIQVGQETVIQVYNNTGAQINNGQVLYVSGIFNDFPTVALAKADVFTTSPRDILIATADIPDTEYGFAVELVGKVRGLNTSGLSLGEIWLSATTAGAVTNTKPEFPNYQVSIGGVVKVDASDGIIQARLDGYSPIRTQTNYFNGTMRESFNLTVSESGGVITGTLEQAGGSGGDLTMMFTDGFTILDCTPAQTITLTAGTDAAPVMNYIYIPQSTKTLTVSNSDWPSGEHIRIADVLLQSATATNTYDALANRNWNDHLQGTDGQGGHSHVGQWIRNRHAAWYSGTAGTITIVGASSPDDVYFSNTAGKVFQKHLQDFDASDMATGSTMFVVNHPTTAYTPITNLNTQLTDASGSSMSGDYFNIVVWGVNNKTGESDQIMVNLPTGSYGSLSSAISDVSSYNVFDIPTDFTGKGFLIAKYTFKHAAPGGGTWTLENTVDLRGKTPSTAGGGIGGGGATDFLSLTDTPASYSGQAGKVATVNGGETALEFTDIPVETISDGNTIDLTLTGTDLTGEVIISSDSGNRLTTGTDNALHVPAEVDGSITNERDTVTILSQDSILIYTRYGAYLKQDTIRVPGSGSGHDPVTLAGLYDYLSLSNQQITLNAIDLTSDISGILPSGNIGAHNHTESDITDLTHTPFQTYTHSGVSSYQNTLSDGGGSFTLTSDGIVYISQIAGVVQIGATEVDGSITNEIQDADEVNITDAGGYFTGTDVESALQEIGAAGLGDTNLGNTDLTATGNRTYTGTTYNLDEIYDDGSNTLSMIRSADTIYYLQEFSNNMQAQIRQNATSTRLYRRGLSSFDSTAYMNIDNTGLIQLAGGLKLSRGTPISSTGTQNDYQLPQSNDMIWGWTGSANLTLTGIDQDATVASASGFNGNEQLVIIENTDAVDTIILRYDDTGSTLGNRFNETPANADVYVAPGETVWLTTNGNSGGGWGVIAGTFGRYATGGAGGSDTNLANTDLLQTTGERREYDANTESLHFINSDTIAMTGNRVMLTGPGSTQFNLDSDGFNFWAEVYGNRLDIHNTATTLGGQITLFEGSSNGSEFVSIKAPDNVTTGYTMILPPDLLTGGVWHHVGTGVMEFVAVETLFDASDVDITDAGGYFTGTEVETALQEIGADLAAGSTDSDAIHDNVSGEIQAISGKIAGVDADIIIIEDSENSWAKKKLELGDIPDDNGIFDIGNQNGLLATDLRVLIDGSFNIDDFMYFDGADGLGLNQATPEAELHIYGGSASTSVANGDEVLILESSVANGLQFQNLAGTARIYFGDVTDANVGIIEYNHGTDSLQITTNALFSAGFSETNVSLGTLTFNSDQVTTGLDGYVLTFDEDANEIGLAAAGGGSADGNGLFSAINDGQTIPSGFNAYITNTLDFGTFFRIDEANDRIGIGQSFTPEVQQHNYVGTAGTVTAPAGTQMVLESDADSYFQFQISTGFEAGIIWGTPADDDAAKIEFDPTFGWVTIDLAGQKRYELDATEFTARNYDFDIDQTLTSLDGGILTYRTSGTNISVEENPSIPPAISTYTNNAVVTWQEDSVNRLQGMHKCNVSGLSAYTITSISNGITGCAYTLWFINADDTDTVTWPSNVKNQTNSAMGTDILSGGRRRISLVYDGTNYIVEE